MFKNKAFYRGFTLIELMIVIVILGILMGTILPRLTGAQSRTRDTARKADLTGIAQALEVYLGDFGKYPDMPTNGCLSEADTSGTYTALAGYIKGGKVPTPPSDAQNTLGCIGSYFYKPLPSGGVPNTGYVLATDVEAYQMANYDIGTQTADVNLFGGTNLEDPQKISAAVGELTAENSTDPTKTIFIILP